VQFDFRFKVPAFEKYLIETVIAKRPLKCLLRANEFIGIEFGSAALTVMRRLPFKNVNRRPDKFAGVNNAAFNILFFSRVAVDVAQVRQRVFSVPTECAKCFAVYCLTCGRASCRSGMSVLTAFCGGTRSASLPMAEAAILRTGGDAECANYAISGNAAGSALLLRAVARDAIFLSVVLFVVG